MRLMATIWADTHGIHDDLATPEDVDAWLDAVGVVRADTHATDVELSLARRLRDAVRRLAALVTGDDSPVRQDGSDVDAALRELNAVVTHLPTPRLVLAGNSLREDVSYRSSPVTAGLARAARESIALLGGPEAVKLRACNAPGCVLYFMKTHPRREWCSIMCGNRARAARHYEKVRSAR